MRPSAVTAARAAADADAEQGLVGQDVLPRWKRPSSRPTRIWPQVPPDGQEDLTHVDLGAEAAWRAEEAGEVPPVWI